MTAEMAETNAYHQISNNREFALFFVREFNLEPFDIVLIFGLLYHLEIDDQIGLLRRCQSKVVLVDTSVYCPDSRPFPSGWMAISIGQLKGYLITLDSKLDLV